MAREECTKLKLCLCTETQGNELAYQFLNEYESGLAFIPPPENSSEEKRRNEIIGDVLDLTEQINAIMEKRKAIMMNYYS